MKNLHGGLNFSNIEAKNNQERNFPWGTLN